MVKFWNTKTAHQNFVVDERGETVMIAPVRQPVLSASPVMAKRNPSHEQYLDEYARLAALVGVKPLHNEIERFKAFLVQAGITVFSLTEVQVYMDKKAKDESPDQAGWHWCPLREKDARENIRFGKPAVRWDNGASLASDYYYGAHTNGERWSNGASNSPIRVEASSRPYDRTIPLHALRKVALIESRYKGDIAFFVSDYAPAPQMQPDPFLMSLVPNPDLDKGEGRFVIDVWDEPGFGIEQMLK